MKTKSLFSVCLLIVLMALTSTSLKAQWWTVTPPAGKYPLHRLSNPSTGKHMLAGTGEAYSLFSSGWNYEGSIGYMSINAVPGSAQVYRYFLGSQNDHYFTYSASAPSGYASEGSIGYAATSGGTFSDYVTLAGAIYCYHRTSGGLDHYYTNNFAELGYGAGVWAYDGIAFYLYKS